MNARRPAVLAPHRDYSANRFPPKGKPDENLSPVITGFLAPEGNEKWNPM
jgi:hypothetical protein